MKIYWGGDGEGDNTQIIGYLPTPFRLQILLQRPMIPVDIAFGKLETLRKKRDVACFKTLHRYSLAGTGKNHDDPQ
jgi:hypothetical protein